MGPGHGLHNCFTTKVSHANSYHKFLLHFFVVHPETARQTLIDDGAVLWLVLWVVVRIELHQMIHIALEFQMILGAKNATITIHCSRCVSANASQRHFFHLTKM